MSIQPKYGILSPAQQAIADELFKDMPVYKPERPEMSMPQMTDHKQAYRADGGDIGTYRLREIADNPYGDEEKCWLAKRVIALQAELDATAFSKAAIDVLAERQRQQSVEGWTPEHDDQYEDGELVDAAACYAQDSSLWDCAGEPPCDWPWPDEWWKPTNDMRRNLIKAGALILAEIERRDRAAGTGKGE